MVLLPSFPPPHGDFSSPPPHGDFLQHQPVLGSLGHGLEVDGVEVPTRDLVKPHHS